MKDLINKFEDLTIREKVKFFNDYARNTKYGDDVIIEYTDGYVQVSREYFNILDERYSNRYFYGSWSLKVLLNEAFATLLEGIDKEDELQINDIRCLL
jgi:hypothetical protein